MTTRTIGHHPTVKTAVVALLGGLLTLAGIALLVLPGPGFVLVAAGLAVLATQFDWAKKPLDYAKNKAQQGVEEVAKSPWRAAGAVLAALALTALGVLALLGVDLPSVDEIDSKSLQNHNALAQAGLAIVESLDLSDVLPGIYNFAALPLKIAGADGAPARAVLWRD